MEVALELPMQHQNNLSVWLDGTRLAETAREQGLYHTVTTPQKITLQVGWNQLFLRAYALGYDLHFGAVLKADAGQLWRLRLSATPPEMQPPGLNKSLQPHRKRLLDHGGATPALGDDTLRDRRVLMMRSSPDGRRPPLGTLGLHERRLEPERPQEPDSVGVSHRAG